MTCLTRKVAAATLKTQMLSRFRPVGRRFAGLLVALLVGATALSPALHADMDDLACEFGAARSARATHIDANDTQAGPLHCEVCHWLRSIRVFEAALSATPLLVATVGLVNSPRVSRCVSATVAVTSSRGPPLS